MRQHPTYGCLWNSITKDRLVEFCLLEQILPDGPDHPFAKTMLQHFNKLKAPPKSVFVYPTLQAQRDRFARLGWTQAEVKSLWQIWSASDYLTAEDREKLNRIEPFDEWEEFAMFAGHYCVVRARSSPAEATSHDLRTTKSSASKGEEVPTTFHQYVGTRGQRRFGASLRISNTLGEPFISNIFGLGTNTRLRSQDIYGHQFSLGDVNVPSEGPPSRMCHGTAGLGNLGSILCGGRTSPSSALKDSWILSRDGNTWSRTGDLPIPLYRHGVARLGNSHNMAMVLGGKTNSTSIFPGCFVYQPGFEWRECRIKGSNYTPVFGAVLLSFPQSYREESVLGFNGIVLGGMLEDGTIAQQSLHWTLELSRDGTEPSISFTPLEALGTDAVLKTVNRFGATGVSYGCNEIALVGGIIDNELLTPDEEIIRIIFTQDTLASVPSIKILTSMRLARFHCEQIVPRPLLVGISAAVSDEGSLVIMGGGGVCFSMGSYWNEGCYVVDLSTSTIPPTNNGMRSPKLWALTKTQEITDGHSTLSLQTQPSTWGKAVVVEIPRMRLNSSEDFLQILAGARPVIIENLSLGRCVQDWDLESIVDKVGAERKVVVHEAKSTKMDFNAKNFSYATKNFADFMQDAEDGKPVYLRALSDKEPSDQPANLEADFPGLAADFAIPDALQFVQRNLFSSVLRITGSANMWLHYDVMANIYCQIRGSKRLLLFPPADVTKLSFAPGASSSSIDVFEHIAQDDSAHPPSPTSAAAHLSQTHPHEAILQPGEVLFLPALWPHTAQPLSAAAPGVATTSKSKTGVAVNIFFRNLADSTSYAAGRDVYGNRDLAAYEKGRQDVARITRAFDDKGVPADMKEFYILRLAEELLSKRSGSG